MSFFSVEIPASKVVKKNNKNREGENVGKYRIVLVQMGKVIVETNRKTIVLVMLKDTQFENEL